MCIMYYYATYAVVYSQILNMSYIYMSLIIIYTLLMLIFITTFMYTFTFIRAHKSKRVRIMRLEVKIFAKVES